MRRAPRVMLGKELVVGALELTQFMFGSRQWRWCPPDDAAQPRFHRRCLFGGRHTTDYQRCAFTKTDHPDHES